MPSPNSNQEWQTWPNQGDRYSQSNPQDYSHYGQNAPDPMPYIQPHYGNTSPAPAIAELPAPLPPAPPTTTSEQQLKEDQLLAHKLQQMEVEEVRRRSSSAVSQHQRPVSMLPPNPQHNSALLHQASSQSLRPHSQSFSSTTAPYRPDSLGQSPSQPSPSLLPEVVVGPLSVLYYHQSPSENLPIPVLQDQSSPPPPPAALDSTSLSIHLEQHLQVPYPPQWILSPVLTTFYAYQGGKITPASNWLDTPEAATWRTIRPTDHARNPVPASYTFSFRTSNGSFRSPKHSWVMTCPGGSADTSKRMSKSKQRTWGYDLKLDSSTGLRKTEVLTHGREQAILTTYVHALNYDSLRFIGPDGRAYMWVSSSKLSSVHGSRYDTLRHALFMATGNMPDPLYGQIVADHTFWDGHIEEKEVHVGIRCAGCETKPISGLRWRCRTCAHHDVCDVCRSRALGGQYGASIQPTCDFSLVNLPDEALYIRSPTVDPALVIATLQVLKDWEKHTLREEKKNDTKGFLISEDGARKCDLGVMSYWKAGDWDKKGAEGEKFGTRIKARDVLQTFGARATALGNVAEYDFSIRGHSGMKGNSNGGNGGVKS